MDSVYGWETVFAIFFLIIVGGVVLMVGMALFVLFCALSAVALVLLSPWIVLGAIRSWRERRS